MSDDREARRLALALVRLREAGDLAGVRLLLDQLGPDTTRDVLLAQTENVSVLFEGLFSTIVESRLPLLAALYGRPRDQVIADHLELLILRLARDEGP